MALTSEQETFLADFADQGLAEQAAAASRNEQIELDKLVTEARAQKLDELKTQAEALINTGLSDFEEKVVPTITLEK